MLDRDGAVYSLKRRAWAKRSDANQQEIIDALKRIGCEVETISGRAGMPDLLVAIGRRLFLLEVKNIKGQNKVNDDQITFHKRFPVSVVRTPGEAIEVITNYR